MHTVISKAMLPHHMNTYKSQTCPLFVAQVLLIIFIYLLTPQPAQAQAAFVVNENGNFHDAVPGPVTGSNQVTNWSLMGMSYADYEIVADTADANNHFLKVSVTDKEGASNPWSVQAIHSNIRLQAGIRYDVLVELKVMNAGSARIQIHPQGLGADDVALFGLEVPTEQWATLWTGSFRAAADGRISVALHFSHPDNPENVIFLIDRLEVRESESLMEPPSDIPLASGHDKFLGSIASSAHRPYWTSYWNQLTPENAGKWRSVERVRGERDWSTLDSKYELTRDLEIPFRFHVLLWGSQQPDWITGLPEDEQLLAIEDWFRAVAERYPDIEYLEVLNEQLPGHGGLPYRDALGGAGETGWDWIINAFQLARDIFPQHTQLMINDYGILGNLTNLERYLEIIELLQERNLIDAIGVQGHHFTVQGSRNNPRPTTTILNRSLNMLGATGLPIQVTELDIGGNPMLVENLTEEQSDQNQLDDYQRIFPVLWEHPSVEGITLWGYRPGGWRPEYEMHLVRDDGSERPAMVWLREYLANSVPSFALVEPEFDQDRTLHLLGNYPNPFNPSTSIQYRLYEPARVSIRVYDTSGRLIRTLIDGQKQPSGSHTITFDAGDLASGTYVYRIRAGSATRTGSMLLLK